MAMERFYRNWTSLKSLMASKYLLLQYDEQESKYVVYLIEGNIQYCAEIFKDGFVPSDVNSETNDADLIDFETNYKASANKPLNTTDVDGAPIARIKASKKGWVFALTPVEATTAKLNSLTSTTVDGSNRSGLTYKIYDSENNEITDSEGESDCVKTVITWEPPYDYEIIGGQLQQKEKPTTNIRFWTIAVPDIPAAYGGSKEMVGGINLKYLDPADKINADGRVSKLMSYSATYHTNKLQFTLKHDAGIQHDFMLVLEIFRE